jgi:NADH-quinone oxidoreductase subunit G
MVKFKINGRELEVEEGITILEAALAHGIEIPHFCYHPSLSLVGKCRMCLVEIEKRPKLEIACATEVADGMVIHTESEPVKKARQAVLEFTLKNHPIDCPICDKAGECTLQDYYMAYDQQPSRLSPLDAKVKKKKALVMGETLMLDQERCILCDRCIRFMREVAKNDSLCVARRRDRSVITTFPGMTVDDPYSLCLTDICPVGAWTGRDFRFKKRAWFLTRSPSICPNCARGCNIFIDHEDGMVYRIRPRENPEVNSCWACDSGRLAYHAINENRLTKPLVRKDGRLIEADWDEALASAARLIRGAKGDVAGVLSADATQEEGELFKRFVNEFMKGKGPGLLRKPEGDEDELLIRADKNANVIGLAKLGIEASAEEVIGSSKLIYYLATLYDPEPEILGKALIVQSPLRSSLVEKAQVALPAASYAESEGTWLNFEGKSQGFKPALLPPGGARPHRTILNLLAREMEIAVDE